MARQLVFTSAPQGLTPGRTGYGTVARHADLRERLVSALEQMSSFPSDWQPTPVICSFRLLDIGGMRIPVLSRLVDAGHDYTHRSHFLAHHLIFDQSELAGAPTPADIFVRWRGWLTSWDRPPRWFDEKDLVNLTDLPPPATPTLPAQTWNRLTGEAARAALLTDGLQAAHRVLRCSIEQEDDLIHLLRESSALLTPADCWRTEFTTCLQPAESASSYRWAGVRAGSPADAAAVRGGALLDLTQPGSLPPPPITPTARLAREGPLQAKVPASAPRQNILQIKPRPPTTTPGPSAAYAPAPGISKAAPKSPLKQSTAIILGIAAALIVVGIAGFMLWPPDRPVPPPTVSVPPAPPMPVFSPMPTPPAPISAPTPSIAPGPAAPPANLAVTNEQVLLDIERLAGDGKFLDALAHWKTFAANAPDFAQTHIDVLKSRLLPGARKEWVAAIDHLIAQLATGPSGRAELVAQFEALRGFPKAWPVANPDQLTQAVSATAAIFNLLNQLPDAPVFIVDGFTTTGAGTDYQDVTTTVALPELSTILAASAGQFHVSAASASSIIPPPATQWFNFDVQTADFASGDFLILPDASRGEAGGRFFQLLAEGPGKTRLNWRLCQPQSDFFQRFPANAPLGPASREMWLHFTAQPPLTSFYLLLRRPDNSAVVPWKPLALPLTWLEYQGSPALVSLPAWLAGNLPWHALPGQSFRLVPTLLDPTLDGLADTHYSPAATPAASQYEVASLTGPLNDKIRAQQTDLARAQQQLTDMQAAATGPANLRPASATVDQTAQTVKNLQSTIALEQATIQKVSKEDWPRQAAPWMLYDTLASKDSLIFLQFTPHETGSSP